MDNEEKKESQDVKITLQALLKYGNICFLTILNHQNLTNGFQQISPSFRSLSLSVGG